MRECVGQDSDAVEGFRQTDVVFVLALQIARTLQRHALDEQARSDTVVRCQDEPRVQLLGLQHVVLQHSRQFLQRLAMVAVQSDHTLIRFLAGLFVGGVERDGAAALAAHVEHRL